MVRSQVRSFQDQEECATLGFLIGWIAGKATQICGVGSMQRYTVGLLNNLGWYTYVITCMVLPATPCVLWFDVALKSEGGLPWLSWDLVRRSIGCSSMTS